MRGGTQCRNHNTGEGGDIKIKLYGKCKVLPDLITIPAHHIKNVEDPIGVAVDTVKDGVTVSRPK